MDRLNRSIAYVGLGLLLTAAGCRSTKSEVPPARQGLFSRLGQQQQDQQQKQAPGESTVNFNQEPRQSVSPPYSGYTPNASGLPFGQAPGMNQPGMNQPGMNQPGMMPPAGMTQPGMTGDGTQMTPPVGGGLGANTGNFGSDPGFGASGTLGTGGVATQPGSRWENQPGASAGNMNPGIGGGAALPAANVGASDPNAGITPGSDPLPQIPVINASPAVGAAGTNR